MSEIWHKDIWKIVEERSMFLHGDGLTSVLLSACFFHAMSLRCQTAKSILSWEPSARPCTKNRWLDWSLFILHTSKESPVCQLLPACAFSFLHSAPVTMRMFRIRAETNALRSPGPFLSGSTALATMDNKAFEKECLQTYLDKHWNDGCLVPVCLL